MYWGIEGIVLATPILLALKVIAEKTPDSESMLQFLGPNKLPADQLLHPLKSGNAVGLKAKRSGGARISIES